MSARKSISVVALCVALISASAATEHATAEEPTTRSCPPPYDRESPLKMITRGVSCEAAEQIVLKVNALMISDKPLHPIAGFNCQVKFRSGRPIQCDRGGQMIRSPIPVGP